MNAYHSQPSLWDAQGGPSVDGDPSEPEAPHGLEAEAETWPLSPAVGPRGTLSPPEGLALNAEQIAAVTFDGGHCLVLAGAGSGKTRTIIARAATLLSSGVPPERVLVLAYTRRAAKEIGSRLETLLGERAQGVVTGTFHHFCLLTMRRHPVVWGVAGVTVLDRDDAEELWRLVRTDEVDKADVAFPKVRQIADWYSYARNCDLPFEDYIDRFVDEDDAEVRASLARISAAYEARKLQRRYLDFDDILVRFADGLTTEARLRAGVAHRFEEVLVDEFQDTNPVQWRILEALATATPPLAVRGTAPVPEVVPSVEDVPGTAAAVGVRAMLASIAATPTIEWRGPRLYCVGDDAQSIYAFRGADFANVHSFGQRLPGATVLTLDRNYRSHQEILDVANGLLSRSPLDYRKRLVADRGPSGERPVLLTFDGPAAEGGWIARDLVRRHNEHGTAWGDHLVLLRTAWSGREIEAALVAARVPYILIGGTSFLQAAHVKDAFALLRASLNARDELAWSRYLRLWRGIGDVKARRVIEAMDPCGDVVTAIGVGRRVLGWDEPFAAPIQVRRLRDQPSEALATAVRSLTPLLSSRYDHWPRRLADLELLTRLAERHRTVEGFLDTYTLDPVVAERIDAQDDHDRVQLITVHSAKGSEADVVYVAAATGRNYPHVRNRDDASAIEEERRVLYVALTRARDELIITRSIDADHGWVTSEDTASFLEDLPVGLVTQVAHRSPFIGLRPYAGRVPAPPAPRMPIGWTDGNTADGPPAGPTR